jgi:hypothetical protein
LKADGLILIYNSDLSWFHHLINLIYIFADDTFIYFENLVKFLNDKSPLFPAIYGQLTRKRLINESQPINYPVGGPG